jgi:DnaK suppressor protein
MALSEHQIADLRARMIARSRLLEGEIAAKLRDSTEDMDMLGRVGDNADLAWVETESGLDLSEAQRDIEEWRGLRDALRRIEQGSYGVCTDCGADVPVERLHSQPLALRCIGCQSHVERRSRWSRAGS